MTGEAGVKEGKNKTDSRRSLESHESLLLRRSRLLKGLLLLQHVFHSVNRFLWHASKRNNN